MTSPPASFRPSHSLLLLLLLLLDWAPTFSPATTAAFAAATTKKSAGAVTHRTRRDSPPHGDPTLPSPLMFPSGASGAAVATSPASPDRSSREFDCPSKLCDCYVYSGARSKVWLNCTVQVLEQSEEINNFMRSIPVDRSTFLTITCTSPARSYLYERMASHLSNLIQLDFKGCHFHDIPENALQGLHRLEILTIRGASLLGHIHPNFTRPAPGLWLLELLDSHVTFLPPLCGMQNLRTLNVSYNQLVDLEHAGIMCADSPLTSLEILDVNYNNVSGFPDWLGDSVPNLMRLSSGDNFIGRVDASLCGKLSNLMFLDLTVNRLEDASHVRIGKCSKLRILGLGSNPLVTLPSDWFREMSSLQHLYLFSMGLTDDVWDMISNLTYLQVLELQGNSLATVSPAVMRDLSSLQSLNLSMNAIRDLPKKAFLTQYQLKSLDLSSNGMVYLPRQTFSNLINLEHLSLSNNSITGVDQTTFIGLRSLKRLNFSRNELRSIPAQSFVTLSNIRALDFSRNKLSSISSDAFIRMDLLVHVDLSHNRLLSVPSMSGLYSLTGVDLSYNNLDSLPSSMFSGLRNLTSVVLRGNRITSLSPKTFHDCSNLRRLDLAHNRLQELNSMLFFNVDRLEYLDLSYNAFSSIESMFRTVKLETLLLRGNNLKRIYRGEVPQTLEILDLSLNQISHISPFTFTRLASVRLVNLTFNELTSLSTNSMEVSFTQMTYAQPLFLLEGNPLRCDCDLGWLKDWEVGELPNRVVPLPNFGDLDRLTCWSGLVESNHSATRTLKARERSEFVCSYKKNCGQGCMCCGFGACFCNSVCPSGCRCYKGDARFVLDKVDCSSAEHSILPSGIPDGATEIFLDGNSLGSLSAMSFLAHQQTHLLRLNSSDIHYIENNTFRGLLGLKKLYLQDNSLGVVFTQTFKDLEQLEFLYLQDNEIAFIEEGSFAHMTNLKVLSLERNLLTTLSFGDFRGVANLRSLHLAGNPWTCGPNFTCPFFQFLANSSAVEDVKRLLCYDFDQKAADDSGRRPNGTPVLSAVPMDECGDNLTDYLNITRNVSQSMQPGQRLSALVVVSVMSVLAVVSLLVIYLNRHLLQVWCFTKFGWRVFKMAAGGEDKDRPYDAFVSYSNLDEQFVVQELAPRLENGYKHFKLCLHYRDFPVGASIAETIVKSVESSKRTLILVSANFLDSEWCKFEFQTAHQQVLTERKNRVIMILLHDVDEAKLDQTLRLYMRTRTYLKYDDPWFWEKLMFAMPDKKAEKFERLPSSRDLEYMARVGRTPTKTVSTSGSPSITNGHPGAAALAGEPAARRRGADTYEVPVPSVASYERVNESMSVSSSLYNGGSLGAGSGHYEEVTPRHISLQAMNGNPAHNRSTPPPLPPLPKKGLLSHEAVRNSSKEMLTRDENWV